MLSIVEASENDYREVAEFVEYLLIELDPNSRDEILTLNLSSVAKELLASSKIWAFLAKSGEETIGLLTLHECAGIYAGGIFGEISELYVLPEHRSSDVGQCLVEAAMNKAKHLGWKRLEVGTPPSDEWPRTIDFYKKMGFEYVGERFRRLLKVDLQGISDR